ncbi:MAG: hypothetical protein ACXVIY_12195 [Mucilaginibacter sp.]
MNRDRGNREWLNDYMSLKQVNPNNPFTTPEGYFDSLNEQILSKIKLEEMRNSIPEAGFAVPENYFEDLAGNIQSRIAVEEALDKEAAGFAVPEGYFENLEQQIQSRIFVEEAMDAQPAGFDVPDGYFTNLTSNILDKTTQQKAERKGVVRRMFSTAAFKYATAACLVLGIGGTLYLNQAGDNPDAAHKSSFLHKSLSAIPVVDIQNYLQSHLDANDTKSLMDETKQADADNLSHDLENALDSTSQ